MSDLKIQPDSVAGGLLRAWWTGLKRDHKGDRAELKRCAAVVDVVFVPYFHDLYQVYRQRFPAANEARIQQSLPIIAALLAQVDCSNPDTDTGALGVNLPWQMARPSKSGREVAVSELRFRRLVQTHDREDLFLQLRQVIRLLGNQVDIYNLANDVYWWDDKTRKRWAYDYYGQLKAES